MQFSLSCRYKFIIAAIILPLFYSHEAEAVDIPPPNGSPPAPVLTEITISGATSMDEGTTEQYLCTATYSDGTSADVDALWSDVSPDATIDNSGVLTVSDVNADQEITLTASYGGKSDTLLVVVADIPATSIVISGQSSLDEGSTAQYTCTASYSDGSSAVVTPNWNESSDYITIDSSGLLSAGNVTSDQNVTLAASFDGVTDTYTVTVKYIVPVLTRITISGPQSLAEKAAMQYVCTASYTDGTSKVVVPSWSENSAYATIGTSGLLNAGDVESDQSVMVTASYQGKSDTHTLTINNVAPQVVVTSLTVAGPGSIEENTTAQYICTVHYSDGSSSDVVPVWSEDSTYASISGTGLLTANNIVADESVTVTASFNGKMAAQILAITAVGDQAIFPLSGFDGKTVSAELWDDELQESTDLGEEFEPEEIVIENVNLDQWYWLGLREYDAATGEWVLVHGRWFRM